MPPEASLRQVLKEWAIPALIIVGGLIAITIMLGIDAALGN
jgi:hypothetical protein